VTGLGRDVRFAARSLARRPGFTTAGALTLALGIGGSTAIFSVVDAVLLRPLPFAAPDELFLVRETSPRTGAAGIHLTPANFEFLRSEARAFESLEAYEGAGVNLQEGGEPERIEATRVSVGLIAALGVEAERGRLFRPDESEPARAHVVLVSDRLWRRRFAADPGLLGRSVLIDGTPHDVVGVLPPSFDYPPQARPVDVWLPLTTDRLVANPRARFLRVVGRLAGGEAQAEGELRLLAERLRSRDPQNNDGLGLMMIPLRERIVGGVRTPLWVLLGAVSAVLLIACANVSGLFLARGVSRRREMAIRTALGASQARIILQLLAEGCLLALLGGLLAWLAAAWAVRLLVLLAPPDLPRLAEIGLDGRVFAFALLASGLSGLASVLLPALQAARQDPQAVLRDVAGPGFSSVRTGARRGLVVAEIALVLPLLIASGLLLRSLAALGAVDPGFQARGVLTARTALPSARSATPEAFHDAYQPLLERLGRLPDVVAAAASTSFPFQNRWRQPLSIEGRPVASPRDLPLATISPVTPAYFAAMGIPLQAGRAFDARDRASTSPVAVIDEVLARRFFGNNNDPLGRRVALGSATGADTWLTVVGVVGAVREAPEAELIPELYLPLEQVPPRSVPLVAGNMTFVLRTQHDPRGLATALRAAVRDVDPGQPVFDLATLEERQAGARSQRRFQLGLLFLFGAVGLLLACVGLYGVVSHQAAERTRELGVRIALGAGPLDVLGHVCGEGLRLVVLGAGLGLGLALGLARLMGALLFGVGPADPATFLASTLLILATAFAAAWLPTRRALRTDLTTVLRQE
jgi:predicted permease